MIIEIDDELFSKVKSINISISEQLEQIKTISLFPNNTLQEARDIKTQRIKQSINETIKSLYSEDMNPTKYQIKKRTGIAYVTINKYYDVIIAEVNKKNVKSKQNES